jgi:threonine 3-dehydrogenase
MKALIKKEPIPGLWMEEAPIPEISPDEVLIKTHKTSICGTDVHIYKWDDWAQKIVRTPMIIGHEFMGEVAEIGNGITGLKKGDRVTGEGHLTCGHCPFCLSGKRHLCPNTQGLGVQRHGCFAEYFHLPAENVFLLPPTISDDLGAIFDPFGNAVHTALSFNLTGEDILITGAGPIGLMAVAIAKKAGARNIVITDPNSYRLELGRRMGATHAFNNKLTTPKEILKTSHLPGFSVGLEMSGHPQALATQLELALPGAHLALLGILPPNTAIDWNLVIFKMLNIKGIYGREIFSTWYKMVHLIESGLDLAPLITHHFIASDFEKGFAAMSSGECGKVILDWSQKK